MIKKDSIYGSGGELGPAKTDTDFRLAAGISANRVALASDVNAYHNMSDKDLWVVCNELVNLLGAYGIAPNNSYTAGQQNQLATLFSDKLSAGYSLTGIDSLGWTGDMPTQNGNLITFPQFDVVFNTAVLYGNTQAQLQRTTVAATPLSATSAWPDGVHYIYAETTAGSTTAIIKNRQQKISASEGATKCMLGSVFVINGAFQADTWKFQPWLQITAAENREMPTAMTKGGFVSVGSGTSLIVGPLQILDEGINWASDHNSPNIMEIPASGNAESWKYVYPGYNPSTVSSAQIDTTQICNMATGLLETIPASQAEQPGGAFIVMVPCVTPAGQFLLVPAMGEKSGDTFSQVFSSQQAAANAVYGLKYSLNNAAGHSVVDRCIFLGYSLVVKVGATDFNNPEQFMAIGVVPQELAGFVTSGGQSGGGSGAYVPMRSVTFAASAVSPQLQNNSINIIIGNATQPVAVQLPGTNSSTVNQFEIHYTHTTEKQGITFPNTVAWWGSAPTWVAGNVYNIIFEYINGKWIGGYLTRQA